MRDFDESMFLSNDFEIVQDYTIYFPGSNLSNILKKLTKIRLKK